MVVVRIPVELVNGDVNLVRALDKIEAIDREERLCIAQHTHGLQLLNARVRAVTADAFGVEDSNPNHEILILNRGSKPDPDGQRFTAVEHVTGLLVRTIQLNLGDLDLARAPAALGRTEHVSRSFRGLDRVVGKDRG